MEGPHIEIPGCSSLYTFRTSSVFLVRFGAVVLVSQMLAYRWQAVNQYHSRLVDVLSRHTLPRSIHGV